MRISRLKVFVTLLVFVGLGLSYIPIAEAAPPNPSLGTATVDGNAGEWDLINDFFADMFRAGDPTKKVESKLYLRYDCATNTMYALVLTVTGVPALVEPQNAWIAINGAANKVVHGNSGDDGTPPDFAWVGIGFDGNSNHAQGWEASFSLAQGSYEILAHVNVFDDGASQTSAVDRKTDKDGIALVISCAPPAGQGTIVINLDTVPNDAQDFTYSNNIPGCSPSFSLDDDAGAPGADATLSNTKTCTPVSPGSYTVTQGLPVPGFLLTSLVCVDPDNGSSTNLATGTATIDLDAGETVICTYTNTKNDPVVEAFKEASLFNDKNGNGKVNPGDIVLYTVTISNNGGAAATNVTYNDTVDTKTILICSAPDAPTTSLGTISSCTPGSGGSLTVNIGSMATGGSVTIKYKVEVTTGNFNKVSNQGKATGTNFAEEKTDDPVTAATKDPTVVFISDPSGFIYDEDTAQIIAGGKISVTGPGAVTIVHDGSAGFYEWFPNAPVVPGVYTITLTPPPGFSLSTTCLPKDPPPFDPTGGPNPTVLGSGEDPANPGFLTSNACTDYYFTFDLESGDPEIQNNNFPLKKSVVGGDPPIWGDFMVFGTPESALGVDLDGDGRFSNTVLRYKNLRTGEVVNTGIPVSGNHRDIDLYEDTVVFVMRESSFLDFTGTFNLLSSPPLMGPIGTYHLRTGKFRLLNIWGSKPTIYKNIISISGSTIRYYDLNTSKLTDTGIPGQAQALWSRRIAYHHDQSKDAPPLIHVYNLDTGAVINTEVVGSFPTIWEDVIAFTTQEKWVAQDLNGDGDQSDSIIRYYDLSSRTLVNTGEIGQDPAIYGRYIVFSSGNHIRYFDLKTGRAFDTGKLGAEPDIYEETITYYVFENLLGADVNGDRDQLDPIVRTHKISESDRILPQTPASSPAETTPSSPERLSLTRVLHMSNANAIRFLVQGVGVESIEVEVYDLQGKRVFKSESARGTVLTWNLTTQDGRRVANGVYLYVIGVHGADGKIVRSQVQKLVVLR